MLGMTVSGQAQESGWRTQPIRAAVEPAVTLGPPTVSLRHPRPMTGRGDVAPCGYGIVARGVADDKNPMPPGPTLPAAPSAPPSTLSAPTPMTPAEPAPGMIFNGPVTSGPIMGDGSIGGPLPGMHVRGLFAPIRGPGRRCPAACLPRTLVRAATSSTAAPKHFSGGSRTASYRPS